MFKPFEPRAGPTGGDGFAAPPLICNLINPATSFAIFQNKIICEHYTEKVSLVTGGLHLLHLHKTKIYRGLATKDLDHDLELLLCVVNLFNDSIEA